MDKKRLYYLSQFTGWGFLLLMATVWAYASGQPFSWVGTINLLLLLVLGISTTHLYREIIIRLGWLKLSMGRLVPRILLATVLFGIIFVLLYELLLLLLFGSEYHFNLTNMVLTMPIWSSLLFIWSLIYFAFYFFQNYRREEIKNLQWEASSREFELNRLKSQLNPHFIFNSMNTIRALVDEDPVKAKRSITQLANVLRTSLLTGKKKLVTLEEELTLVKDYLEIEAARYEERLKVVWDIDSESTSWRVPPLMVQTLVENAIKHGIATLPEGGTIHVTSVIKSDLLLLQIANSGIYNEKKKSGTGFGIYNTHQRLELLYGKEASFQITNEGGKVVTRLILPAVPN